MGLHELNEGSEGPNPNPLYRNPVRMFELYTKFKEQQDGMDGLIGVERGLPDGLPTEFKSRWALSWWMRGATDEEVLSLMNFLATEVEPDAIDEVRSPYTGQPVPAAMPEATRAEIAGVVAAEDSETFPRLYRGDAA
jgi:hypothetical protein